VGAQIQRLGSRERVLGHVTRQSAATAEAQRGLGRNAAFEHNTFGIELASSFNESLYHRHSETFLHLTYKARTNKRNFQYPVLDRTLERSKDNQ
jgi:hypothetical protein